MSLPSPTSPLSSWPQGARPWLRPLTSASGREPSFSSWEIRPSRVWRSGTYLRLWTHALRVAGSRRRMGRAGAHRGACSLDYEVRRTSGPAPGSRPGFCLCAMTRALPGGEKGGTVELYSWRGCQKAGGTPASGVEVGEEELERLHLAHELYHALEFSDGPLTVDAVPKVRVRGLLGRPSQSGRALKRACRPRLCAARDVKCAAPSWIDATVPSGRGVPGGARPFSTSLRLPARFWAPSAD